MRFLLSRLGKWFWGSVGPRALVAALFVALLGVAIAFGVRGAAPRDREVGFTEIARIAETGGAASVHVDADRFVVKTTSGESIASVVDDDDARHDLVKELAASG